jgi:hypothetical protein
LIFKSNFLTHFAVRWHAQMPWRTFFWRDLLLVGTLANALMGFAALILLSQGANIVWALGAHFGLLPYNFFLLLSACRWPGIASEWKWAVGAWFSLTLIA